MSGRETEQDAWWDHACRELVPRAMAATTGCDPGCAREVGADIASRGRAFARCGPSARDVLITPFVEEAIHHRPLDAPLSVRSAVVVVVRNSLVERDHALGHLADADIRAITKVMTELLHAFLVMRPRAREAGWLAGEFAGLPGRYPRAWSAFATTTPGLRTCNFAQACCPRPSLATFRSSFAGPDQRLQQLAC
ncbi:hypothetical protein I6A60_34740 [Frankia sp. AgB1.9]|nr:MULTISPECIES: hypothetical protein [unclassified Frankia]MBL7494624.1 hypothetical protein [Frankia sp. AgW1.1]MBL7552971.1 hypothetical protein [Frankia sp. AgB1.9]MBL7625188.1 hypothetical protein [Frankia sp. AgB1.8]